MDGDKMDKYVEKLKSVSLNFGLLGGKEDTSVNLPPEWGTKKKSRYTGYHVWIVAVPVFLLLSLAVYFIVVNFNVFGGDVTKKDVEEAPLDSSWLDLKNKTGANAADEYYEAGPVVEKGLEELGNPELEEDPGFVLKFDYIELGEEEIKLENVNTFTTSINSTNDTLIILQNDDSGKKIYLKATSVVRIPEGEMQDPAALEDLFDSLADLEKAPVQEETKKQPVDFSTEKSFTYSPTIPQPGNLGNARPAETTDKYNNTDDSRCFSTKLGFCEGVLPYDVVQLPEILGVKRYEDLKAVLPYFQMIIESGCSLRIREFICSLLEPECQPEGQKQALPCKLNCKVVSDDCRDFILQSVPLSKVFDCRQYPDWAENEKCVNFSKGQCYEEEHQCSDGTCIPLKWVCDGVHDCPGPMPTFDESDCKGCAENEFRCVLDGKCIPLHWKCDGRIDCTDHSDELSC